MREFINNKLQYINSLLINAIKRTLSFICILLFLHTGLENESRFEQYFNLITDFFIAVFQVYFISLAIVHLLLKIIK